MPDPGAEDRDDKELRAKKELRDKAEATIYRLLARRDHTREELRRKLADRDHTPDVIAPLLDEMEAAGYLDDARFAHYQAQILARKEWGPLRIHQKLRARGVAEHLIDGALDDLPEEHSFRDTARDRLLRKFGDPSEFDDKQKQRAYRHMVHRGYPPGLVRGLIFA